MTDIKQHHEPAQEQEFELPDLEEDWYEEPCKNPTGHFWNSDDYCVYCGADGRA